MQHFQLNVLPYSAALPILLKEPEGEGKNPPSQHSCPTLQLLGNRRDSSSDDLEKTILAFIIKGAESDIGTVLICIAHGLLAMSISVPYFFCS